MKLYKSLLVSTVSIFLLFNGFGLTVHAEDTYYDRDIMDSVADMARQPQIISGSTTPFNQDDYAILGETEATGYEDIKVKAAMINTRELVPITEINKSEQTNPEKQYKEVSYIVKEDVYKTIYTYSTNQSSQAFTTTDTKNILTARDSKGNNYNVIINKGTLLTKVKDFWYKAFIHYTNYIKKAYKKKVKQGKKYFYITKQMWLRQDLAKTAYVVSDNLFPVVKKVKIGTKDVVKYKLVPVTIEVSSKEQVPNTIQKEVVTPRTNYIRSINGPTIVTEQYSYQKYVIQKIKTNHVSYKYLPAGDEYSTDEKLQKLFDVIGRWKMLSENDLYYMLNRANIKFEIDYLNYSSNHGGVRNKLNGENLDTIYYDAPEKLIKLENGDYISYKDIIYYAQYIDTLDKTDLYHNYIKISKDKVSEAKK